MRLVLATPLFPPESGGPATYAELLMRELPARGIEVELVKFSDVRHLPKLFRHFVYEHKVRRALKGADAVLALDPVSVGYPAMRAAKALKKPLLVKVVGDYAWEQGVQRFGVTAPLDEFVQMTALPFPVRTLRRIETAVAQFATKIIVPSDYLKGIVTQWGIEPGRISVVYNSVATDAIGSVPTAVTALPSPRIVSVGRLVPWKGMDGLIDAVVALREQGAAASLVIVGEGPEESSLRERAKKLGNACVFTGRMSHEDTLAVMREASVFVLNTSYEGLSHTLIEALMLGLPIITTPVGGNPEVTKDSETALWIPAGDTAALTSALARVLTDPALAAALSTRAKESSKRFSVETMLTKTATLLTSP